MAAIYGQLVKAQLENLASDIASPPLGVIYYNTGSNVAKYHNGSAWRTLSTIEGTETLLGKTLTTPQINSGVLLTPNIDDYVDINEESAPSSPSAGKIRLYGKTDKKLYAKNSDGVEVQLGGGGSGSGEINTVESPNDANGWAASGAGVAVATTTTANELPLGPVIDTAIKITPSSGTDYARYRFQMPESLKNRKLKIEWHQRYLSSYASGDFKVEIYKNSASDYTGSYTEFNLSTDSSGTSSIPAAHGKFSTTFDSDSGDYYELRIVRTAGTSALCIAGVVVGPGIQPQGAVVGEWISYTPTGPWLTNATYTGKYRRVGDTMECQVRIALTGAPTAATLNVSLPAGFTIDTTKMNTATSLYQPIGRCHIFDDSASIGINGVVLYGSTTVVNPCWEDDTATGSRDFRIDQLNPITFANLDKIDMTFTVPIAEWSGNGTVNIANGNDVEFAYNSTVTDASDTTAFAYGPAGVQFATFTAPNKTKRVRFPTPIQPSDHIVFEYTTDSGATWLQLGQAGTVSSFFQAAGTEYGVAIGPVNSTDMGVEFTPYRSVNSTTWGSAGNLWSGISNSAQYKWRLKKIKGGLAVGFGLASTNSSGLVNPYTEGSGVVYSGSYTPTLTTGTNVASLSGASFKYMRVGKIVHVVGQISTVETTASNTNSEFYVSLPIASNLAAGDLSGVFSRTHNTANHDSGRITEDATNDRAQITWFAQQNGGRGGYLTFSYEIK